MIKIFNYEEIKPKTSRSGKSRVRKLISAVVGPTSFELSLTEKEPGDVGYPASHPWEHVFFILEGRGLIRSTNFEKEVKEGDVIYIPPNVPHQIFTAGDATLKWLYTVPVGIDPKKTKYLERV